MGALVREIVSTEGANADTICPYRGVGRTLTVHAQDNQIVKVTSPLDQEVTHVCHSLLRVIR